MGSSQFAVLSSGARAAAGRGGRDYTPKDRSQWARELTERVSVEAMKVYHLTIQVACFLPIEYRREEPWASERNRNSGRVRHHAVRRARCAGPASATEKDAGASRGYSTRSDGSSRG